MYTKLIYECEICRRKGINFSNEDHDVVEKHEAEHYNLSVDEYRQWNVLKKNAENCGYIVMNTNNDATNAQFDEACDKLADFEIQHGIKT
ncbi:hypothetical protein J6A31_04505 [bacterium]|nr:hypothetical protein [bacterium]